MEEQEKHIWTPDDAKNLFKDAAALDKMITVRAEILTAKYHEEEMYLIVAAKLSNGEKKSLPQHASCFKFNGKLFKDTPKDEVHAGMRELEKSYLKAKGKKVFLTLPETKYGV